MLALFQRYHRHLILLLLTLLGLACGFLAASVLGTGLRGQALPTRAAPPRPPVQAPPETDLGFILQHDLFNPAARSASPVIFSLQAAAGRGEEAPRGDLVLVGTVVAGGRSLALIRSGQELKSYHLDAEIAGGRIEEILRHQVNIRNHTGSLTILRMTVEGAGTARSATAVGGTQTAEPRGQASATATPASGAAVAGVAAGAVREAGSNRWIVARSAAEAARANVGEQLRSVLFQPNLVNGKTDGFVVRRIQPGSLLAQMGLQRGDVVKSVNRMPLDSPEKGLQIMQQLREARQISIDLERAGKPLSFAYEIE